MQREDNLIVHYSLSSMFYWEVLMAYKNINIVKIDYSEYTLEQLQALLMFIDKNKYPEREKEIIEQIIDKQKNAFTFDRSEQLGN